MAWVTVNVLAPVLLTLLLLALAKTTPAGHRLQLMETLKDGQLCWFAITLSAATFYELMQNDGSAHRVLWCSYGMAGVALVSGVYAVVAAIQPTVLWVGPPGRRAWIIHYRVFLHLGGAEPGHSHSRFHHPRDAPLTCSSVLWYSHAKTGSAPD